MTRQFIPLIFAVFATVSLSAQKYTVEGHHLVEVDSTWVVPAGADVYFTSKSSVEVLGGLQFEGTAEAPVNIYSDEGAIGFLINGINNAEISFSHVNIFGLVAPVRMDPFWYRRKVSFEHVTFRRNGTTSGGASPIVSISEPYLSQSSPMQVHFKHTHFANNNGGLFIDGIGREGWFLGIDDMAFEFNAVGSEQSIPMHLEVVGEAKNYKFSRFLFNQNDGQGLLLTGYDVPVTVDGILVNAQDATPIIAKRNNYRLPELRTSTDTLSTAFTPGFLSNVLGINHTAEKIVLTVALGADVRVEQLLAPHGLDTVLPFTAERIENKIYITYEGPLVPSEVLLASGIGIAVPELQGAQLVQWAEVEKGAKDGGDPLEWFMRGTEWADQFFHPKDQAGFEPSWEVGASFGFSLYDGRDLKMIPFSTVDVLGLLPNIGLKWPGGQIGYTGGLRIQQNKSSWWSNTMEFNMLNVNGGKAYSFPYRYTRAPILVRTINNRGLNTSYDLAFTTAVQTLEFGSTRHLRSYQLKEGKSGKWIPSMNFGVGLLHFTPYRATYLVNSEEPFSFYLGNTTQANYNLRRVGTAGQTTVPGMSKYSTFAAMASTGISLTRLMKKGALKAEVKGVMTTTDYLDDFSRGTFFGGDYDGFLQNLPAYTYIDPITGQEEEPGAFRIAGAGSYGGSRAQNYLPDGYWEVKLSYSVFVDRNPLEKPHSYLVNNMRRVEQWWDTKKGPVRSNEWEWSALFGTGIYDGRDLKYHKIAGVIPVPTNLEFSRGLYLQKNETTRFSWNVGLQATNLSYYRLGGSPYIRTISGRLLKYNSTETGERMVISSYDMTNFFTKTTSVESNLYFHLADYKVADGRKWSLVPSFGLGIGLMNYTPYRQVSGIDRVPPRFLEWQHRDDVYVPLREVGSEGQNILPNGRAYSPWAGVFNGSFQLSLHTKKWIFKGEVKANTTTTDYLDDFGRGAWFGGNYERWSEALNVGYIDDATGSYVTLTPEQVANMPDDFDMFTPRARNNATDGFVQFHIGLARNF